MSISARTIIAHMNQIAPPYLKESWDHIGLQVGDEAKMVHRVLLCLTPTESVLAYAKMHQYDFVLAHHPLFFQGPQSITTSTALGRQIIDLIKHDIGFFCAHTNLDSAQAGVNDVLAGLFALEQVEVLAPQESALYKIIVYVPQGYEQDVHFQMATAGAGTIGNYTHCGFHSQGQGIFLPTENAHPTIGERHVLTKVDEVRLEMIATADVLPQAITAMKTAHPYEEVAYDIIAVENRDNRFGIGRLGVLPNAMPLAEFLSIVKEKLHLTHLKYTGDPAQMVSRIALCGGSGSSYINVAASSGADVFLTGDLKYHDAQKAVELGLSVIDGTHYATERPVLEYLVAVLGEAFGSLTIDIYPEQDFLQIFA